MAMQIVTATTDHLEQLAPLFDRYRIFYGQDSDVAKAKVFLTERITTGESVMFLALENGAGIGFTQLYPSFTSVGMARIWILNDLYVDEASRGKGVAEQLIQHALHYSRTTGRKKVILSTAHTNTQAQRLYERMGFDRDAFYNYEKTIG
jgi:ribosomal protein S18 acetylase RimI-like enzyme